MGVAGTAMVGTGLLLWSNKRKTKLLAANEQPHFGIALVDRLNLGTIIGLPIAIAAYFWANRLQPATMADKAAWEVHAMYLTLAAMLLYPVWPARKSMARFAVVSCCSVLPAAIAQCVHDESTSWQQPAAG